MNPAHRDLTDLQLHEMHLWALDRLAEHIAENAPAHWIAHDRLMEQEYRAEFERRKADRATAERVNDEDGRSS